MAHPNAKPWPLARMIEWYQNGSTIQEIADLLSSDSWQPYWRGKIQAEYRPGQKIVNKILKKHIDLRGRGAPGSRNRAWKGGRRVDKGGYTLVYQPDHPMACSNGCVREHRLIAEKALGRFLTPTEVVHHIDDDPSNNDPANLMVYETNGRHIVETRKGKLSPGQKRGLDRARVARWNGFDSSKVWPHSLISQWHKDGLSLRQMAELLTCDVRTVSRQLTLLGITDRHRKPGVVTDLHREQCRRFLASLTPSTADDPM